MNDSQQIEKSLSEQIIDKMIEKLNDSEYFTESILIEIKDTDLTNKNKVQEVISKSLKDSENENPKTGN
ncbi:hypothetical protein ES708_19543 [subsurface metagenome]